MKQFPKGFMVGAATAAHQVEGNNTNSDYWVQEQLPHSQFVEPSLDAVDHYNRYEEDIKLMAEAGLNAYRFSIEWARIEPKKGEWDEKEIEHYRQVLKCCHENGIKPIVTMMHFSSPAWLISEGGWENPEVVDLFAAYCKKVTQELGDQMEYVCTINEANMRLQLAAIMQKYMKIMMGGGANAGAGNDAAGSGENAGKEAQGGAKEGDVQVGLNLSQGKNTMIQGMMEAAQAFGVASPMDVHTFVSKCTPEGDILVMKAHQAAKAAIKEVCPQMKVGLSLSLHDFQVLSGDPSAAEKEWEDEFAHYVPYIAEDDFFGAQCYTRKCFADGQEAPLAEGVSVTQMGYEDYPQAIGNVVRKVAELFKGEIIVTENGIATDDDARRCQFVKEATESVMACMEDGIPVKGYMYWSLLDNFEWQKGFSMTFGLIGVDRSTQTRYPKESLKVLGQQIER